MYFKTWLEVAELAKPTSKVRKTNIVKDKGTNVPRPAIQFKWTTKLGNVVKLHFDFDGEDAYRVIFYVNDTLYDNSPKNTKNGRDPEILSGIFYLLKNRADSIGAKELSFRAHESNSDTKTIRNLDVDKSDALRQLNVFERKLKSHSVQMIPPTQNRIALWKKLNRPEPQPMPDFQKEGWLRWVGLAYHAIQEDSIMELVGGINELKVAGAFDALNFDIQPLIDALQSVLDAALSNTPEGWKRTRNRRTSIYRRLVDRYLADDWDIEQRGDWFNLTKKTPSQ